MQLTLGALSNAAAGLARIAEVPIYAADALARRAPSLQQTRDAQPPLATMSRALADRLGLREGDALRVTQDGGSAVVGYAVDDGLPADCVRLALARSETAALGDAGAALTLERVAGAQKATA